MSDATDRLALGVVLDGPPGISQGLLADWRARYRTRVFEHRDLRLPLLEGRVNRVRLARSLERLLADSDAVYFDWAGPLLVTASRLPRHAPVIVRLHSFDIFEYAPRVDWDAVSRIVFVSRAMQRRFCDAHPEQAGKSVVVHNGVDLDRFAHRRTQFGAVVGTLCNLLPIKRVYELILSVHRLVESGVDVTLRVGGPHVKGIEGDRYDAALQRLVKVLALEDCVSLVGPVEDPAAFLKSLDIFVSNSYWEGQQVALLEAMAAGCYCLSHAWDGAEEVLPPHYLFATDGQLCEKVREFLSLDASERQRYHDMMAALAGEKFGLVDTQSRMREVIDGVVVRT